jgi:hypothetical protein
MVVKVILSISALALFYGSIKDLKRGFYFKKNGILTEGEVENVTVETDSEGSKTYLLIVKFMTNEGVLFKKVVKKAEDYYHEGIKVHVLYDPENPLDFLVNDPEASSEMEGAFLAIFFGILFSIIAFYIIEHPELANND